MIPGLNYKVTVQPVATTVIRSRGSLFPLQLKEIMFSYDGNKMVYLYQIVMDGQ